MQKIKERMTSKVVWIAVVAQIALVIAMFNEGIATDVKVIATSAIEVLTLFGILNNPSNKDEF